MHRQKRPIVDVKMTYGIHKRDPDRHTAEDQRTKRPIIDPQETYATHERDLLYVTLETLPDAQQRTNALLSIGY